jgi:hypothetical protein
MKGAKETPTMNQQLQPIVSGFLWGLGSSLVLIVALVAARDATLTAQCLT